MTSALAPDPLATGTPLLLLKAAVSRGGAINPSVP
jgi:hypothetical protein